MEIIYKALSELIPYANNAKQHPPVQVANLAESIRRFGFRNPVLIDGGGVIVAGHGRCLAAAVQDKLHRQINDLANQFGLTAESRKKNGWILPWQE